MTDVTAERAVPFKQTPECDLAANWFLPVPGDRRPVVVVHVYGGVWNRGEPLVAPTDVADADAVAAMVESTVEAFGGIDVLVNNADVLHGDDLADADWADLRAQIEVNLLGTMHATHAALPAMLDSGGGHIVAISSMNACHPAEGASAYTASKFGVNGFYRSLRKEMSDEAGKVTVVMPGPVQTEMSDWSDWDGRALDPADVADAVEFAVSRPDPVEIPDLTVNTTDKLS